MEERKALLCSGFIQGHLVPTGSAETQCVRAGRERLRRTHLIGPVAVFGRDVHVNRYLALLRKRVQHTLEDGRLRRCEDDEEKAPSGHVNRDAVAWKCAPFLGSVSRRDRTERAAEHHDRSPEGAWGRSGG